MRATVSVAEPAAWGTIRRIGLSGYSARAVAGKTKARLAVSKIPIKRASPRLPATMPSSQKQHPGLVALVWERTAPACAGKRRLCRGVRAEQRIELRLSARGEGDHARAPLLPCPL